MRPLIATWLLPLPNYPFSFSKALSDEKPLKALLYFPDYIETGNMSTNRTMRKSLGIDLALARGVSRKTEKIAVIYFGAVCAAAGGVAAAGVGAGAGASGFSGGWFWDAADIICIFSAIG